MSEVWIASFIALWILVLVMAFLLLGALREIGLIQLRIGDDPGVLITQAGLERATLAPDFTAIDSTTQESTRLSELPRRDRVLIFMSPSCASCQQLARHINEVQAANTEFDFVVICQSDVASCRSFRTATRLSAAMVVDVSGDIQRSYDAKYTPFAYLLDAQRRVLVRGIVNNWRQLEALLNQQGTIEPPDASGTRTHASERVVPGVRETEEVMP